MWGLQAGIENCRKGMTGSLSALQGTRGQLCLPSKELEEAMWRSGQSLAGCHLLLSP